MRKRLLTFLVVAMTIIMCTLGFCLVGCFFGDEGELYYSLNFDGESYTVSTLSDGVSGDIVIPAEYNGMPVTVIGDFYNSNGVTSITIPNSITRIYDTAFNDCGNIEWVYVDANNKTYKSVNDCILTKDGKTLIFGCKNSIIPESVTKINSWAFIGCGGLTNITIPNSVESIGFQAFKNCSGLSSIAMGNSVESISSSAFEGCSGLTYLTISDSVTYIGEDAFKNCSGLRSISIGKSEASIWKALYGCSKLEYIEVDTNNELYRSDNNCLLSKGGATLILGCKSSIIPNSVTKISDSAFSGCVGLTRINIPDSVESIGKYAFSGCSGLTNITIPNSVTSIGESAFNGCSKLKIRCEAESKPDGWDTYWNISKRPVSWGING